MLQISNLLILKFILGLLMNVPVVTVDEILPSGSFQLNPHPLKGELMTFDLTDSGEGGDRDFIDSDLGVAEDVEPVEDITEDTAEDTALASVSTDVDSSEDSEASSLERVEDDIPRVPFFSQSADISSPEWRGRACGVASLAMIVEYYYPGETSPQELLDEGLNSGHYLYGAGWTHQGLATMAKEHGLFDSAPYDLSYLGMDEAYVRLLESLEKGPVIVSIFHEFDPQSPIPHLAVINGVDGGTVYYNDPAGRSGGGRISKEDFMAGWKKRFIAVHP